VSEILCDSFVAEFKAVINGKKIGRSTGIGVSYVEKI
jgi:hypothetical protein